MKTKHSRSEINALAALVTNMANDWPAEDTVDKLIKTMLTRFAIDLNNKIVIRQSTYKLSWHPERALAFAVAVEHLQMQPTSYEGAICLKLTNQIIQTTTMLNI